MLSDLATAYRVLPLHPGDEPHRWAVPMPPPHALPGRIPWLLLYLMRSGYYGGPIVTHEALLRREPAYPPRTLDRALEALVDAGYLVPLDRCLQRLPPGSRPGQALAGPGEVRP
jgi:hypothetical protein